jgi:hypothetical protein
MNRRRFFGALAGLAVCPLGKSTTTANPEVVGSFTSFVAGPATWRFAQFGEATVAYKDPRMLLGEYLGEPTGWDFGL